MSSYSDTPRKLSWQDWVDFNIDKLDKKYDIDYYFSDSEARDEPVVFRRIEETTFKWPVGVDQVDQRNDHDKEVVFVKEWLQKVRKEIEEIEE